MKMVLSSEPLTKIVPEVLNESFVIREVCPLIVCVMDMRFEVLIFSLTSTAIIRITPSLNPITIDIPEEVILKVI